MDDLDGAAGDGAAALAGGRLADEEARAHEAIDHAVELGVIGRELVELGDGHDGARALGGDQAQEQRAHERLLTCRAFGEHGVGVASERADDAADAVVADERELPAILIAHLPQLGRRELQERQRAGRVLEVIEHRLDHRRGLELIAGHLGGLDQRVPQAVSVGRRQEEQAVRELGHERGGLGDVVEEVGAQGQDEPKRRRDVVAHAGEARGEREPLARVGDLRV
jgi:hypothetical protein